jgi:2-polyprenyl-6-methoxyphenol hydroxylase-like FAD-dependent oxidoreductase
VSRTGHAPVAIVGAGPTGLALALGLARHGVRSVLLEQKEGTSRTSKAPAVHLRTREVLRQWGVADRLERAGSIRQPLTLHTVRPHRSRLLSIDFSELAAEAEEPGLLVLEQDETERILLEAVRESGLCDVRFRCRVRGLSHDGAGVRLHVEGADDAGSIAATYAVGCDGAASTVREALGLPFPGMTYSLRPMLADVEIDDHRDALPQPRTWNGSGDFAFAVRLRPGLWRIVHLERAEPAGEEVSADHVAPHVDVLLGRGPFRLRWGSRFRIHVRAAPRFREGSVFLAGDAAHVHSPASGFGMNGGIQDAHNLAWKLARALAGPVSKRLLDSYDAERRDVVVEDTSRYTDRVTRLFIQAPRIAREMAWTAMRAMLKVGPLRRRTLRRITMLDLGYDRSPLLRIRHRAAGTRVPDPLLRASDGRTIRLYRLLPVGPVLLDVAHARPFAADPPLPDVIRIGPGGFEDTAGLLRALLGNRDGWILVRPDACIAWARHETDDVVGDIAFALGGA